MIDFKKYDYFKNLIIEIENLRISQSESLSKLTKINKEKFCNKAIEKLPSEHQFNFLISKLTEEYNKFVNLDYDFKIITNFNHAINSVVSDTRNIVFSNSSGLIFELSSNVNLNIYSSNNKTFKIALYLDEPTNKQRDFLINYVGSEVSPLKKSGIVESGLRNILSNDLIKNNHFLLSNDFYDNINYLIIFFKINHIVSDKHESIEKLKKHTFNFKDIKSSVEFLCLNEDFIMPSISTKTLKLNL